MYLTDHSDAKLLFASDFIWKTLDPQQMPQLQAAILLENFELAFAANEGIEQAYAQWQTAFLQAYPGGFQRSDVHYQQKFLAILWMFQLRKATLQ